MEIEMPLHYKTLQEVNAAFSKALEDFANQAGYGGQNRGMIGADRIGFLLLGDGGDRIVGWDEPYWLDKETYFGGSGPVKAYELETAIRHAVSEPLCQSLILQGSITARPGKHMNAYDEDFLGDAVTITIWERD